jgi:hypothetical protein
MVERRFTMSKAEMAKSLRLAGYPGDTIRAPLAELADDPVDLEAAAPTLERYGVTRARLMARRGASP